MLTENLKYKINNCLYLIAKNDEFWLVQPASDLTFEKENVLEIPVTQAHLFLKAIEAGLDLLLFEEPFDEIIVHSIEEKSIVFFMSGRKEVAMALRNEEKTT